MDNVIYLQKAPQQIAHFLRVGFREHVLCDHLRAAGKLAPQRFVFDAGNLAHQKDLLSELRAVGAELVLDTNIAEQSVDGRFSGAVSDAPWAFKDRPLEPDDFQADTNRSVIEPIARCAVESMFHTVLTPAHYLSRRQDSWFSIDCRSCEALRIALDREGGKDIAIDYLLIVDNQQIKNEDFQRLVIDAFRSLPIENLWIRIGGFGSDATGAGIDRIARAVHRLHELGVPIIIDQIGGLAAFALTSFGIASGFSNSLKGKDRFDTSGWLKPKSGGGGGNPRKIFVSGLDRRVTISEMKTLFANSTTARSVYGCPNGRCCGSIDAMLKEPEAHRSVQQGSAIRDLSRTPETLRSDQFLTSYLDRARRDAARALNLRNVSDEFGKLSEKASFRLDRMSESLENTAERLGKIQFSPEAKLRTRMPASSEMREFP